MRPAPPQQPMSAFKLFAIIFTAMVLALLVAFILIRNWLFPQPFTPVSLNPQEQQQLEQKLERFERASAASYSPAHAPQLSSADLQPEAYSEAGASHEILLSEREINAVVAQNSNLGQRMVVDLAQDLVSVKLLIPLDPDFPIMGGKVLKVRAGAELAYRQGRPVVILRGISVMGIPLPNAWLGGLKNIDLIETFGADPGFWKSLADGVAAIDVGEGHLRLLLRE